MVFGQTDAPPPYPATLASMWNLSDVPHQCPQSAYFANTSQCLLPYLHQNVKYYWHHAYPLL